MGFKAAGAALERLKANRSEDEEIVAIVENNSCYADAVQVLTGCTFGKGNFIYEDHGKMALTLLSRKTGQGVRVALRPGAFAPDEEHLALLRKVMSGNADEDETERFHAVHLKRSCDLLDMSDDDLFVVNEVKMELPDKARIEPSEPCAKCGEPTMRTRLEDKDGMKLCRACVEYP